MRTDKVWSRARLGASCGADMQATTMAASFVTFHHQSPGSFLQMTVLFRMEHRGALAGSMYLMIPRWSVIYSLLKNISLALILNEIEEGKKIEEFRDKIVKQIYKTCRLFCQNELGDGQFVRQCQTHA